MTINFVDSVVVVDSTLPEVWMRQEVGRLLDGELGESNTPGPGRGNKNNGGPPLFYDGSNSQAYIRARLKRDNPGGIACYTPAKAKERQGQRTDLLQNSQNPEEKLPQGTRSYEGPGGSWLAHAKKLYDFKPDVFCVSNTKKTTYHNYVKAVNNSLPTSQKLELIEHIETNNPKQADLRVLSIGFWFWEPNGTSVPAL